MGAYLGWPELLTGPAVESLLLVFSSYGAWRLAPRLGVGLIGGLALFYGLLVVSTLTVLALLRTLHPFRPGHYSRGRDPAVWFFWRLQNLLLTTNLFLHYENGLAPPLLKKHFYRLLGARTGPGMLAIGGRLLDPSLISIGSRATLGSECLLTAHLVTSSGVLILGRIDVASGVQIGVRAVILPGVSIGENSMIAVGSVVAMNTRIPANEIWAGSPAQKVGDVSPRARVRAG